MTVVNRTFKDRVFRRLFSTKEALLSLYNAVNGTDYSNADELIVNTLEDAIYLGMKNDVSFLFSDVLSLYEHQSTVNPNMPLRGLFYLTELYRAYIADHQMDLYLSTQIEIPCPQYVVFYNGLEPLPDRAVLRLSDAFKPIVSNMAYEYCLELTATVLNINYGQNRSLMEKCDLLKQYSIFISYVRDHLRESNAISTAIDSAISRCIENGILSDFLKKSKAEVKEMILYEWDQAKYISGEKAISRKEGEEAGYEAGKHDGFTQAANILRLHRLGLSETEISSKLSLDIRSVQELLQEISGEITAK